MIKCAKPLITCFIALIVLWGCPNSQGQSEMEISIDSCYGLARKNYPLIQQFSLIEKSRAYSLANASKGYLPRITIGGQASFQSDVIQIPFELPGAEIPMPKRNQYKIYGEIVQPITDIFTIDQDKKMVEARAEVPEQQIEVELYKLYERINHLYFGILLMDAQLEQLEFMKNDIQTGIEKTNAALANGTAIRSSVQVLHAEMLKAQQRGIELKATRSGYKDMLALFINQDIGEETRLKKPPVHTIAPTINRPELILFERQKKILDIQNSLISANKHPRFDLFFQGGYGRPALNLLRNDFDFYYVTGLRLNWNISSFYTQKNEKQLLNLDQKEWDVQLETFLFNTQILINQQDHEINKLFELIQTDKKIIQLRESIKNTSEAQLENGITTVDDYLTYLNEENRAKQDLVLHQIQLLLAQYHFKAITGN